MLLAVVSHECCFLSTIIFSTPLHKVRHFQFCHAILDVTYGALGMCTAAQVGCVVGYRPSLHASTGPYCAF